MKQATPGDIKRVTEFKQMPWFAQAHLLALSVWAQYVRRNAVGAWARYWRAWRKHGGYV